MAWLAGDLKYQASLRNVNTGSLSMMSMGTSCSTHEVAELFLQLYVSLQYPRLIFSSWPITLTYLFPLSLALSLLRQGAKDWDGFFKKIFKLRHPERPIIEVYSYQHAIPVSNRILFVSPFAQGQLCLPPLHKQEGRHSSSVDEQLSALSFVISFIPPRSHQRSLALS